MFAYFCAYVPGHSQACHATMWSQGTYCGYCTGGTDFHFLTDNEGLGVWLRQQRGVGGGRGCSDVYTKKKKAVVETFLQFSSESPKTLNNFLPNEFPSTQL